MWAQLVFSIFLYTFLVSAMPHTNTTLNLGPKIPVAPATSSRPTQSTVLNNTLESTPTETALLPTYIYKYPVTSFTWPIWIQSADLTTTLPSTQEPSGTPCTLGFKDPVTSTITSYSTSETTRSTMKKCCSASSSSIPGGPFAIGLLSNFTAGTTACNTTETGTPSASQIMPTLGQNYTFSSQNVTVSSTAQLTSTSPPSTTETESPGKAQESVESGANAWPIGRLSFGSGVTCIVLIYFIF